jgi:antitoxin FitA
MAQLLVRDLDDRVVQRLKSRAAQHKRSLQAEARKILEEAVPDADAAWKRIDRIFNRFKRSGRRFSDSVVLIREDRDR